MSKEQTTEDANKNLILTGIRDNLLKPMAEEICARTDEKVKALQKLLWWMIGIVAFSALIQIVSIIMLLKAR